MSGDLSKKVQNIFFRVSIQWLSQINKVWVTELKEKWVEAENGLFRLSPALE